MTEKEEGPEPYLVPETDGDGMTAWRLEQIEEAEEAGTPLDLTDKERAEVEELRSSTRSMITSIGATAGIDWAKMNDKIGGLFASPESAADMARRIMPRAPMVPDYGMSDGVLDDIVESKRIEREREERNSANIGTTAEVMKDMLAAMQIEAEKSAARDEDARKSARKNYRVAMATMLLAAVAAVPVLLLVIDAIKWW
jgi:hypothetical protein